VRPGNIGHSLLRPLIGVLVILYVTGTLLGGMGLGWIALHPQSPAITVNEDRNVRAAAQQENIEFRDVEITTPDGASLKAWLMRPDDANGDAVILLHGVSDNRLGTYGYGKWLVKNHYSVLLPDSRAHGNSTGELATYGLRESKDIHQWIDWLEAAEHPHCVFGLGESMGAAQLLQSLLKEHRFCAVVAESPFASFREIAYDRMGQPFHVGPWLGRSFFRPTVDVGFLYVRLRYGLNLELASPENAVNGIKAPILLIHGLDDRNIPPYHSDLIQRKNPSAIVVWKVPGAAHTGAHTAAPQEFERRVLEWFDKHSVTSAASS